MECFQCQKFTPNPKFCSLKCSATYNNTKNPKRQARRPCDSCGRSNKSTTSSLCRKCRPPVFDRTIGDIQTEAKYQRNSQIRGHARRILGKSKVPKHCGVCLYDKHVEVSHIVPISNWPEDTLLSIVNSLDNLEYLCPNHHWEHENSIYEV